MSRKHRIFFVTQDAGGFQAVIPVYRALKERQWPVKGMFGDVVRGLPTARGLRLVSPPLLSQDQIQSQLLAFRTELLVIGGSTGLSLDKLAVKSATKHGIPTLALLDSSFNFDVFFSDPGTRNRSYLTREIAVIHSYVKGLMVKEGFDARHITVTGNPYFDSVLHTPRPRRGKFILFIEQPDSELDPKIGFGYTESEVFADVIVALEGLGRCEPLILSWHPRTRQRNKFDQLIAASSLRIRKNSQYSLQQLIESSRLVIGMNSIALLEAALRGVPVISYQPHLTKSDTMVSNRWKLSVPVYEKSQLSPVLRRVLDKPSNFHRRTARDQHLPRHATQAVIRLIQEKF